MTHGSRVDRNVSGCRCRDGAVEPTSTPPKATARKLCSGIDLGQVIKCLACAHSWRKGGVGGYWCSKKGESWLGLGGDDVQRDGTGSTIAGWKVNPVGWRRESNRTVEFGSQCHEKRTLAHLRNTKVDGIEKRVGARVAPGNKDLTHLLCDVVPTIIEHVWHIFEDNSKRSAVIHVPQVVDVEPGTRIMAKRFWVISDLAEL